ncbi:sulfate adenylyltransferase [Bacillus sp. V-88]|nr:sulfate adenylyltransferase [Bacillus sp. DSM 27956]PRX71768.1 sulfate adenylyltransferase [Bacillus sp. V-88]SLK24404.1 sulfate adenylyltransferase [Bacillus sp. V-88]
MISPHGGMLVDQVVIGKERDELLKKSSTLPSITLDSWGLSDLVLISTGAFSPLTGFMNQKDYLHVLKDMRLSNGLVWSLPITLPVPKRVSKSFSIGETVSLKGEDGVIYGTLEIEEIYEYSKEAEALFVFRTLDNLHPGVQKTFKKEDVYVSGPVKLLRFPAIFKKDFQTPKQLRERFNEFGWNTVVAFQTRNPIHRAHEYLQKTALELVDGLLIHPLVGDTKQDDIPADIRMKSYRVLVDEYYPTERVLLSTFPAAMRYAGPREALFHSIVRKNFGCTHFIVGRDHAGVGDYYGTYEAQEIFNQFSRDEIGIEILKFEHAFHCIKCGAMATSKTCPHDELFHIHLSGTKVRKMLKDGTMPPQEFSRPEVIEVLLNEMGEGSQRES